VAYDQELKAVLDFYGDEFEQSQLGTQLQHLTTHFKGLGNSQKVCHLRMFVSI